MGPAQHIQNQKNASEPFTQERNAAQCAQRNERMNACAIGLHCVFLVRDSTISAATSPG